MLVLVNSGEVILTMFSFVRRHFVSGGKRASGARYLESQGCSGFGPRFPIPSDIITIAQMKSKLYKRLGGSAWLEHRVTADCSQSRQPMRPRSFLPPRSMRDSFCAAVLPLSTDAALRDRYVTFLGHVRFGRLMEDLDIFSVWVMFQHIYDPLLPPEVPVPYNIVTVLVDSIDFSGDRMKPNEDVRLSGHVTWCSKTTAETELFIESHTASGWKPMTRARFLMAARNFTTGKGAEINELKPADDTETAIWKDATDRRARKREEAKCQINDVGPSQEEVQVLHELKSRKGVERDGLAYGFTRESEDNLLLERARLSTTVFTHPEDRNIHGTVFGGFLLRMALELSWSCVWLHTRQWPSLLRLGDVLFRRPVALASLLRMRAFITYTDSRRVAVTVYAYVHEPKTGETFRTNDFHFVYLVPDVAPEILPRTYEEGLMYLEGRRIICNLEDQLREIF